VSSEAATNGDVHLDCFVERSQDEGETWALVRIGHRSVVLDGGAVLAITENEGLTNNQKRAQLTALFRQEIVAWGIHRSDDADQQLQALVSFPARVTL